MWNKRIQEKLKVKDSKKKCHPNINGREIALALFIAKILFTEESIIRSRSLIITI